MSASRGREVNTAERVPMTIRASTAVRRAPGVAALNSGERRMHRHHAGAEAAPETIDQLRRQGDLRHEHQRLAAICDGRRDHPQIHLGLAAARDPVEQVRGKARQGGEDGGNAMSLMIRQTELTRQRLHGV